MKTLKEFLDLIKGLGIRPSDWAPGKNNMYNSPLQKKDKTTAPWIYTEWSPGGMSGGNCWDNTEPTSYASDETPKELDTLDAILEAIIPNVTLRQYRDICKDAVIDEHYEENEYYGNYTYHNVKKCSLPKLYKELVRRNLMP
jgi:hypothetical protein